MNMTVEEDCYSTLDITLEKSLVKFNKLNYDDEFVDSMMYIVTHQDTTNCGWVFLSMTSIEPQDKKVVFPQNNDVVLSDKEYESVLAGEHQMYSIIAKGD